MGSCISTPRPSHIRDPHAIYAKYYEVENLDNPPVCRFKRAGGGTSTFDMADSRPLHPRARQHEPGLPLVHPLH